MSEKESWQRVPTPVGRPLSRDYTPVAESVAGKRNGFCRKGHPILEVGYTSRGCRECDAELSTQYRFGISVVEYRERLSRTQGRCELCGKTRKLVLDHDHTTGALRGALCRICNLTVGLEEASPGLLSKILAYIEEYKCLSTS